MISILLAAYNGEMYIAELIESLLKQTFKDFKLYIRDDKSIDGTYAILEKYAAKYPEFIFIEQNDINTGGSQFNFMQLMIDHRNDYLMLCDQDDIWLPEKIAKSFSRIKEMEQEYGASTPLLVHTDLKVTDKRLNVIRSSYKKMANLGYNFKALNNLVAMNMPTGCTIMYNRALADLINVMPDFMVMHDWWISITAAAFGKIGSVEEQLVLYRQHSDNDIGAKKARSFRYIKYVLTHISVMAGKLNNSYKQAGSFLRVFYDRLDDGQRELLTAHTTLPRLTKFGKLRTILKYNTFLYGVARKVAQVIVIILQHN